MESRNLEPCFHLVVPLVLLVSGYVPGGPLGDSWARTAVSGTEAKKWGISHGNSVVGRTMKDKMLQ